MKTPPSSWGTCIIVVTLTVKKCFLTFRRNLLCFSLCPLPLFLLLGIAQKSLALPSFVPPFKYSDPPEPSLLQTKQSHLSQPLIIRDMLQSFHHLCGPSLYSLQSVHVSHTGKPRTGHSTPGVASPLQSRGEGSPPLTC